MSRFLSDSLSVGESGGSESSNSANGPSLLVRRRAAIRERTAARDSKDPRENLSTDAAETVAGNNCHFELFMRELIMLTVLSCCGSARALKPRG